jgi:hypothetical protein
MVKKFEMLSILVLMITLLMGCSNGSESDKESSGMDLITGQDAMFKQDSLVAVSKESFQQLLDNANAHNGEATNRMMDKGEVLKVDKGTHVHIINISLSGTELEVLDDPIKGQHVFTSESFLELSK